MRACNLFLLIKYTNPVSSGLAVHYIFKYCFVRYLIGLCIISISTAAYAQDSTLTFHVQNDGGVFSTIDTMPCFKGDLWRYYENHITYPEAEQEAGISGTVYIGFIVEPDGSLDSIKILRGVDKGLNRAALQMIKNMPKFTPGIKNGKAVRVQYSLPVNFVLRQ